VRTWHIKGAHIISTVYSPSLHKCENPLLNVSCRIKVQVFKGAHTREVIQETVFKRANISSEGGYTPNEGACTENKGAYT